MVCAVTSVFICCPHVRIWFLNICIYSHWRDLVSGASLCDFPLWCFIATFPSVLSIGLKSRMLNLQHIIRTNMLNISSYARKYLLGQHDLPMSMRWPWMTKQHVATHANNQGNLWCNLEGCRGTYTPYRINTWGLRKTAAKREESHQMVWSANKLTRSCDI